MRKAAKIAGAAAAAAILALWGYFLYRNQTVPNPAGADTLQVVILMAVLALAGLVGVSLEKPLLVILSALASFIPVGLYLLGVPSIFRLIGAADLVLLLSGIPLIFARRSVRSSAV